MDITPMFEEYVKPLLVEDIRYKLNDGYKNQINNTIQQIRADYVQNNPEIVGQSRETFEFALAQFETSLKVATVCERIFNTTGIHNGSADWKQVYNDMTLKQVEMRNDKNININLRHIYLRGFNVGTLPKFPQYVYHPYIFGCVDGDYVYILGFGTDSIINVFSKLSENKKRKYFYGFNNLMPIKNINDLVPFNM